MLFLPSAQQMAAGLRVIEHITALRFDIRIEAMTLME